MFPAARLTDPITHDQLVPSGLIAMPMPGRPLNVLIEFMPAAVCGDFVACTGALVAGLAHPPQTGAPPAFLPPPPFAPISKGSATVLINNLPAARWIVDMAGCGTFLGDAKLAATRTVLIGG
jgi:uncharacterized Zn-binding protein involved in type VI secretion